MMKAAMEAAFHGGLRLPNGVRPLVSRFDAGGVLVHIEWDPSASDDVLSDGEDAILAFIERRRRVRQRLAAQLDGTAREGGTNLSHRSVASEPGREPSKLGLTPSRDGGDHGQGGADASE